MESYITASNNFNKLIHGLIHEQNNPKQSCLIGSLVKPCLNLQDLKNLASRMVRITAEKAKNLSDGSFSTLRQTYYATGSMINLAFMNKERSGNKK